ncbi:Nitrile-specifier protein 5 [Fusarium oxysporum f. sp. cubense race 1]|uniref:Nitrile-specifier protein 5 n=1 Tax=Fusarium oxysporum f. sp. cubense (strain race 1) TaxID=1229664 RepID=N4U795_FUSC1|nr:Nitrile-specifier protein 5 [Fusarium oxysporum f. sp. cubense race 1]
MASTKLPRATWTRITSSKRLYRSSQAVSSVGQKVYIFGGELLPREPVDNRVDVASLDTQEHGAQTLTAPTKAPTPRVGSPSTTIGSNIFLFSGRGGLEMKPIEEKGAIWRYNTADNTWDTVEPEDPSVPFPDGRSYHCITSDGVDQLYLHSGCPEKNRLNDLWAFDLIKRAWSELPSAPGPARGGSSIAFHDGKLYRMNGFDGKTEQGGALDTYNIEAGSWSTVTYKPDGVEGPEARSVASLLSITVRGKNFLITMFGERDPSALGHAGAGKMLSDVWVFDIEESTWQRVEIGDDRPVARGWFDADVARGENGKDVVIVHGGLGEDNQRLGDVWALRF